MEAPVKTRARGSPPPLNVWSQIARVASSASSYESGGIRGMAAVSTSIRSVSFTLTSLHSSHLRHQTFFGI